MKPNDETELERLKRLKMEQIHAEALLQRFKDVAVEYARENKFDDISAISALNILMSAVATYELHIARTATKFGAIGFALTPEAEIQKAEEVIELEKQFYKGVDEDEREASN